VALEDWKCFRVDEVGITSESYLVGEAYLMLDDEERSGFD
jgi:hypothetical protein